MATLRIDRDIARERARGRREERRMRVDKPATGG